MKNLKQQIKNFWNQNPCGAGNSIHLLGSKEFFEEYDKFHFSFYNYLDKIFCYEEFSKKKVLEVGVGLGADICRYAQFGAEVHGIDLTEKAIELTKKRFEIFGLKGCFLTADAENLPFSDNYFDLVISIGVLHHTPDTQKAIDEIWRVLKEGGKAIIMLYHKNSFRYRVTIPILKIFNKEWRRKTNTEIVSELYDGIGNPLGKVYSRREIRRMFGKFANVKMQARNFWIGDIFQPFFLSKFYGFLKNHFLKKTEATRSSLVNDSGTNKSFDKFNLIRALYYRLVLLRFLEPFLRRFGTDLYLTAQK